MDLRNVLIELHTALDEQGVDHVLIGGLALTVHGAARATIDLDFLADGDRDGDVDALMRAHGYECLHRTENLGNYLSQDRARGRVDFLFARRSYARAMLDRAVTHTVLGQRLRVADAADLIGLKVQASSNDPRRRGRDLVDIERLLTSPGVDLDRARQYFRLFERESELDALLAAERER
ncbi:MAG: nucleotidyl transferase AbiEii/AbiGii toxin family protein [Myxococcota bacterium]